MLPYTEESSYYFPVVIFLKLIGLVCFPEGFHIRYPTLNSRKGFLNNIGIIILYIYYILSS